MSATLRRLREWASDRSQKWSPLFMSDALEPSAEPDRLQEP
jgi:hypothetical protein